MIRRRALPSKATALPTTPFPDIRRIHSPNGSQVGANKAQLTGNRARVYVLVLAWVIVWTTAHMYFTRVVFSNDLLWLQYYVVNYEYGFVRRGLAGELIRIFTPEGHYLTAFYTALWVSVVVWLIAVAVLMWVIVSSGARSERRVMLALVVPVLPFAVSYGVYSPHPELFGMTALLAFSVFLTKVRTPRSSMILSALYGIAIAVLVFTHEAIPLELALGAILAIVVLSKDATPAAQRICAALAVGPGIVSALSVATLGRRDLAAPLCAHTPHGMVEDPWGISTTPQRALDYMLGRIESRLDYHDWVCQRVMPTLNESMVDGARALVFWGFVPLLGAFVLGLLYFVGTIWMIGYFSGVPVRVFLHKLRDNLVLAVLASALLIPLFVTAVDWTRWWILITFDVAIVYLLYAIGRPEVDQAPSRRSVLFFVWVVVVLSVIPLGCANNVSTF